MWLLTKKSGCLFTRIIPLSTVFLLIVRLLCHIDTVTPVYAKPRIHQTKYLHNLLGFSLCTLVGVNFSPNRKEKDHMMNELDFWA